MSNKQLAISRPSLCIKSSSVEAFDHFALLNSSVDNTSILYQFGWQHQYLVSVPLGDYCSLL